MTKSLSPALSGVRHVVWDWNGTLLDDHEHCIAVINGMLRDHGLPEVDVARYRAIFDFPVRRYYERLGFDLDGSRWEALAARFIDEYDRGAVACRLHAGAVELLDALADAGARSSILSAAHRHSIEAMLRQHGLRDRFHDVVGLDDHYAGGKVEVGVEWMHARGIDAARTVLVGDTAHDFEVAEAMGVRCVLVAAGHHARDRLERCGCSVVDRLEGLLG